MSLESRYTPFTLKRKVKAASSVVAPTLTTIGYYRGFIQPTTGTQLVFLGPQLSEQFSHRLYCALTVPATAGDIIEQGELTATVVYSKQVDGVSSVSHHKELFLQQA